MTIKDISGGRGVYPSAESKKTKATGATESSGSVQKSQAPAQTDKLAVSDRISLSNLKKPDIEQVANEALSKVKSQKLGELGSISRKIDEGYFDKESVKAQTTHKIFKDIGKLEAAFVAMQKGKLQRLDELQKMDLSVHSGNQEVMRATVERIVQDLKKL